MSHTPGPWIVYVDEPTVDLEWHVVTSENRLRLIANVHIETGNEMDEANARLIAAAPALLEVCGELLDEHYLFRKDGRLVCPFCSCESIVDCPVNFPHSESCPVVRARQVIAQAKGTSNHAGL